MNQANMAIAAGANYYSDPGAQQSGLLAGRPTETKPVLSAEFDRSAESMAKLEMVVEDFLARISPICQPGEMPEMGVKLAQTNAPEPMPSEVRARLVGLRVRMDALTSRLASTRYSIEL